MVRNISLDGTWRLSWSDGYRGYIGATGEGGHTLDAAVPGEVHLDLMRAGLISDPRLGLGALNARWVEENLWLYRTEFDVSDDITHGHTWLHFQELDYAAKITLNGMEIGRHENAYRPCRIDVTGKLQSGKNTLMVEIESGLFSVADKDPRFCGRPDERLTKKVWLRKPQCSFGWDWSPRLINVGITGSVTLETTSDLARIDQLVPLVTVNRSLDAGTVTARLFVEGLGAETVAGRLKISIPEANIATTVDVLIRPGLNPVESTITVPNPKLWWPVGHGVANRYTLTATLEVDGSEIGTRTARIGFRHIHINQDRHPDKGRYFILEVNGKPIFAKGGNFVPADLLFSSVDRMRYKSLIDLALQANFNMLRVWGGGLYETEDFYDLCDEKGILIWQDFMYACGRYPLNDLTLYENAKAEAVYQVRRLASHPSLVIWCGNNEMEEGNWDWGYEQKDPVFPDYAFFHLTLPRIMGTEDPTRYYQPSSPYSPNISSPNAAETGDQHPWNVGITGSDWRHYRTMICRFPNEGGTLGSNSLPTTMACLPEGQQFVGSFAWAQHDNAIAGLKQPGVMEKQISMFIGKDVRSMSVPDFVYWAGLLQGEALREYIDNFRRRMFDSASAIFWMYNDTWPTTSSWTIVDYYLRRTPSFCPVKRAFAPINVVVAEQGDEIVVFGINDTSETIHGHLRYGIFHLKGDNALERCADVALFPNTSTPLARFPKVDWEHIDPGQQTSTAFAMLEDSHGLIARNRLILPTFQEMTWSPADVRVRIEHDQAIFECDVFAWGVCLDLDGEEALGDNFFDVWPGVAFSIPWTSDTPPRILKIGDLTD